MNWTARRKRKVRRRRSLVAAGVVGVGLALLCLIGLLLGAEQVVSDQALLERPPETIWRVLTDFDGMPLWRSDLTALERLPDLSGRPAWRELGRNGVHVMQLAAAESPRRLVFSRTRSGRPALPVLTVLLVASAHGTLVTLTEIDHIGNPLRRLFNRAYPPRSELVRFLRDLAQRVSGSRPIAHSP
ncbi:MAG TPA: SRPBCC family protein [Gemmatimonadales bacterium]|jgi:uncharacterized protein YndB with AHSA1/START domain|nr:SRPBCC family protein [Gemmatimonadales bacterium]